MVGPTSSRTEVTIIRPRSGWPFPNVRSAWKRRELLVFFAIRDLKVRYAQTVLGVAWTIVQPLSMMLIFTLAFRKIGRVETGDVPYPVFALAGLTLWSFVSRAVTAGADSLVSNAHLVTKTAVPRFLIPLAAISAGLFDFAITFGFLLVFTAVYGELGGAELLAAPLVVALAVLFVAAPVYLLSALNVRYRDVRHVVPFFVLVWLFVSPIAYPIDSLGSPWSTVAALNPLVAIIEGFRWTIVGGAPPSLVDVGLAAAIGIPFLLAALLYFGKTERTFADVT